MRATEVQEVDLLVLTVNDVRHEVGASGDVPLLYVLRNDLGLNGPKYGCGKGQCGACAVLLEGALARSCIVPLKGVGDKSVTTLEGLGNRQHPHPVQTAFIDAQAAQCGYCLNGMVMSTVALLARTSRPTDAQVRAALANNLCRCGTHVEIMDAVHRAAELMARQDDKTQS